MQHQNLFIPVEGPTEFISMINPFIEDEEIILKYLYVKQHSVTKLLYFGVTLQDPIKYSGSGTHWRRHLKKHDRKFVNTLKVWVFNNQSECTSFALNFSEVNNIVASNTWANLTHEEGLCGTVKGHRYSEETKMKMSNAYQNRSQDSKDLRSKKISAAAIKRYQNMTCEEKELEKQRNSIAAIKREKNKTLEQNEKQWQKCSESVIGKRLYDKVGEKSRYFKEQPDDPTWVLRKTHGKRK